MSESRSFRALLLLVVLLAISLLLLAPTVSAQPRDINGTVTTPAGTPVMDAHVYIDPPAYGSSYESTSLGTYAVIYMPGFADKYLRITKPGYEFSPPYYLISMGTSGNLTRNFTGALVHAMTSGMSLSMSSGAANWTYLSIQVPAGATSLTASYSGTGNAGLVAQQGSFPTAPPLRRWVASDPLYTDELVINAASVPPISAGKWYIGLYAEQATEFTLGVTLGGPPGLVTLSGTVMDYHGNPSPDIHLTTSNGGSGSLTGANGEYQATVPYYWSGTLAPDQSSEIYTPATRQFANLEVSQAGQDFLLLMSAGVLADYLLAHHGLGDAERAVADPNGDSIIDAADLQGFIAAP
jgi:hypothetical protein